MENKKDMLYFKASEESLKELPVGSPIMINVEDEYSDFALFLNFDEISGEIICLDMFNQKVKNYNVASYDNCYIVNMEWIQDNHIRLVEEG